MKSILYILTKYGNRAAQTRDRIHRTWIKNDLISHIKPDNTYRYLINLLIHTNTTNKMLTLHVIVRDACWVFGSVGAYATPVTREQSVVQPFVIFQSSIL